MLNTSHAGQGVARLALRGELRQGRIMDEREAKAEAQEARAQPATDGRGRVDGARDYFRLQIQKFITNLKNDCALICETVEESLYTDGADVLENEELLKPLGRISYIDNAFRYFGNYLTLEDCDKFLSDMKARDLETAGGTVDIRTLQKIPLIDFRLLNDILSDDKTSEKNFTFYIFSLWVNYHVSRVVETFSKWRKYTMAVIPPALSAVELPEQVCYFTLTQDNKIGGFFYDGRWFETLGICILKKTEAARRSSPAQGMASDGVDVDADKTQDDLLSDYARKIISNYIPDKSFDFLADDGRHTITREDLKAGKWESAIRLLEKNVSCDIEGWVDMGGDWRVPTRCKGEAAIFFERVHNRVTETGNINYKGQYRICRDKAIRRKGGALGGGRKKKK